MDKGRVEAFSDGVLAIITIMVLGLQAPKDVGLSGLIPLIPQFLSCILSFIFVTRWIGENHLSSIPVAMYGIVPWF